MLDLEVLFLRIFLFINNFSFLCFLQGSTVSLVIMFRTDLKRNNVQVIMRTYSYNKTTIIIVTDMLRERTEWLLRFQAGAFQEVLSGVAVILSDD